MHNGFRKFIASLWEVFEIVLIAVTTVFLIRTFLLQPFLVSGASMEPNFSNGDYLMVDRFTYRVREPARGETVVFRYPEQPGTFFIKRAVALPGERIEIKGTEVRIFRNEEDREGFVLTERYIPSPPRGYGNFNLQLRAGEYFMMGDNRSFSFDSRNWGALLRDNIIGIVRLRLFPFTAFGAVEAPQY